MKKALNRRTVLKGAGGIAVALPFLDAMIRPGRTHAAATPGKAKRFITFFSANGTVMPAWQPSSGGETDFVLGDILSPLQGHRDSLTLLKGINNEVSYNTPGGNPHDQACGTMLTAMPLKIGPSGLGRAGHIIDGTVGGPSVDQYLASQIAATASTPRSSMVFGVQSTSTILEPIVIRISYRGSNDPVTPEDDPGKAFASMFGDTAASQKQVMDLQKKRSTVLDAVLQDYTALMTRLGPDDRAKLDRHATSIRELEKDISTLGTNTNCHGDMPVMPTATLTPRDCLQDNRPAKCVGDFPTIGKAQMDMLTLALACDITRVVTLQWSTAESTTVHTELSITGEHHLMSHDTASNTIASLQKINKWYAQQLSYLLDQLAGITDGDGTTLLDGSIVFWVNELSDGAAHNRRGLGYLLAGKGNGTLRGGRYMQLNGTPHNQLYASLLNMFGFPTQSFGDPKFPGVLPGLG